MDGHYKFNLGCECGCSIIKVDYFDDDWLSLSYFVPQSNGLTFWDRVKLAWKILNNHTTDLYDIVLEDKKLVEFVDWLNAVRKNIKKE